MENGNESFTYFNDEWNIEPSDDKMGIMSYMCDANNEPTTNHDYGDEDFIDNVDIDDITYKYTYESDDGGYEEYGN
jgi:hypothetical protein